MPSVSGFGLGRVLGCMLGLGLGHMFRLGYMLGIGFGRGFVMPFKSVLVHAPGVLLSGQAHMNGLYIKQPPQKFTRHVGKQHAGQAGAEHV